MVYYPYYLLLSNLDPGVRGSFTPLYSRTGTGDGGLAVISVFCQGHLS